MNTHSLMWSVECIPFLKSIFLNSNKKQCNNRSFVQSLILRRKAELTDERLQSDRYSLNFNKVIFFFVWRLLVLEHQIHNRHMYDSQIIVIKSTSVENISLYGASPNTCQESGHKVAIPFPCLPKIFVAFRDLLYLSGILGLFQKFRCSSENLIVLILEKRVSFQKFLVIFKISHSGLARRLKNWTFSMSKELLEWWNGAE